MSDGTGSSLSDYAPLPEGDDQYPMGFIEKHGAIKLHDDGGRVHVGLCVDASQATRDLILNYHRQATVVFSTIDKVELAAYLGGRLAESAALPAGAKDDGGRIVLDRLANDAPIVNLVNSICIDGIRAGASDIHIEAMSDFVRVRYRIDGVLRTARTLEKGRFSAISSRIKIMANLNIMERRLPQDGRISVDMGGDCVDLRVSIVPIARGESIVLRLLGKAAAPLSLDELGFDPEQAELLQRMLRIPHGLVLVTGPTGSGKTTTLNAMLRSISSEGLKIITIEDPVEYVVDGVNQIQTNEAIKLTFDSILRRVLRQDPNVIMVGEIRDSATAELAVRAALTGHLVLSTLHTNSSVSVIPRLRNMGIESYLIASVLQGAVAQRLVRRVCPECGHARLPDPVEKRILADYGLPTGSVREGGGCENCGGSGYRGRTVVSEAFMMDVGLEEMILRGDRVASITEYLAAGGMRSLAQDGMRKVAAGITTFREIEREVAL